MSYSACALCVRWFLLVIKSILFRFIALRPSVFRRLAYFPARDYPSPPSMAPRLHWSLCLRFQLNSMFCSVLILSGTRRERGSRWQSGSIPDKNDRSLQRTDFSGFMSRFVATEPDSTFTPLHSQTRLSGLFRDLTRLAGQLELQCK